MCGIELAEARCDRFLVISLFGCLLSPNSLQQILYRKCGGGKTVRLGGSGRRQEERWGGSVFESEACAVKLCTTPCGAACAEKGNIFFCSEIFPNVNLPSRLLCVFYLPHLLTHASLFFLSHNHSVTFLSFYPLLIYLILMKLKYMQICRLM